MENSSLPQPDGRLDNARGTRSAYRPFSRILVPVDGSDASMEALRVAIRVAGVHGPAITVLYVVEPKSVEELAAVSSDSSASVRRQLEEKGRRYLNHAEDLASQYGVICSQLVRQGILHNQIADVAREIGADLIILGDSRLQSARRAISGSVTERVIEYAPCSVLVVRPS